MKERWLFVGLGLLMIDLVGTKTWLVWLIPILFASYLWVRADRTTTLISLACFSMYLFFRLVTPQVGTTLTGRVIAVSDYRMRLFSGCYVYDMVRVADVQVGDHISLNAVSLIPWSSGPQIIAPTAYQAVHRLRGTIEGTITNMTRGGWWFRFWPIVLSRVTEPRLRLFLGLTSASEPDVLSLLYASGLQLSGFLFVMRSSLNRFLSERYVVLIEWLLIGLFG